MKLAYTIEDLDAMEVHAEFEFHREIDGELVFDAGWDIVKVLDADFEDITEWVDDEKLTGLILRWLADGGEDKLYSFAQRELK